jgi:alpha-beta hydrolase superfamily lysophospholipase/ubiquinone/menaquinone biosynthesis C-methylase UbiE
MTQWTEKDGKFDSWDNTSLFYRSWIPEKVNDKAIVIIHRGHEHSGRLRQMVEELDLTDFKVFSWDNRGHGMSLGKRGHADDYTDLVRDLDAFVKFVSKTHSIPVTNIAILGNSVGAVTACAWLHDYAPEIRCLVLAAPAFRIRLYVPFAIPLLRLLLKLRPQSTISSYVKAKLLTHDTAQVESYNQDGLITRDISVKVLLGLHDTATRIIKDAAAIETPILVISAGADWVVKNSAQRLFYKNLSSRIKQMRHFPGFFHAILYEQERQKPMAEIKQFILQTFSRENDRSSLLTADKGGPTRTEYDLLSQPASACKGLYYGLQKMGMRTLGRMSDGVKLGWETGFDSGKTLDYVYENKPRGSLLVGKLIDKQYLDAIGWKGIRERRCNLEKLLHDAVQQKAASDQEVRILDVATGCSRYVLNVLKNTSQLKISAVLRDYEEQNLEAGRNLAQQMGLGNVIYQQGDAFSREALFTVDSKPNIIIVSGLYELFPDNQMISTSLQAISEIIAPEGLLIYTGQPWHPQVEMIARTLVNRDQQPWIMRRRTQAEMDTLVKESGFEKMEMEIDRWGIFTVSLARRTKE